MTRRGAVLALCVWLASAASGLAQRAHENYIVKRPVPPSDAELDRLNLKMRWRAYLPMQGPQDGVGMVQVLDNQVFAQLRSGMLVVLDANTGETLWRFVYPRRYPNLHPLAINPNTVFGVGSTRLYALDRRTGFTVFAQPLASTAATGPSADLERVFVPLSNNQIVVYSHGKLILPTPPKPPRIEEELSGQVGLERLNLTETESVSNRTPSINVLPSVTPPYRMYGRDYTPSINILPTLRPPYRYDFGNISPSIAVLPRLSDLSAQSDVLIRDKYPTKLFEIEAGREVLSPPIIGKDVIAVPTAEDRVLGIAKVANQVVFSFATGAAVTAPLGQYLDFVYVPTEDSNLFAVNLDGGRANWRFVGGGRMDHKPFVTNDSIYVSGTRSGITRVTRETGERLWHTAAADRVLAMNPKFVYGSDSYGRLHIIDRERGLGLGSLDIRDFGVPIVNEESDRLYLVGDNGLLVCLHDRDYRTAVPTVVFPKLEPPPKREVEPEPEPERKVPVAPEPKKGPPPPKPMPDVKKEPKKEDEMKKDAKKEDAKKEDAKKE
jgi:outer membrane protein assembly factor BamB